MFFAPILYSKIRGRIHNYFAPSDPYHDMFLFFHVCIASRSIHDIYFPTVPAFYLTKLFYFDFSGIIPDTQSIVTSYLASFLASILTFSLTWALPGCNSLRSRARSWGPAGLRGGEKERRKEGAKEWQWNLETLTWQVVKRVYLFSRRKPTEYDIVSTC